MTEAMFILYVEDQNRSRDFYSAVLRMKPVLDVPGMTEFSLFEHGSLGLMTETGIKRLLGDALPDPAQAQGVPRVELYLRISDIAAAHTRALAHGGKEIKPPQAMPWGDNVAYSLDPDGHVLALAEPQAGE
ncbi:MAG: glyoxalase [bacterium]|nr:glyoxalase [bacterium]